MGEQIGLHGPSTPVRRPRRPHRTTWWLQFGMTLAHLGDTEARAEMSPRVALLMAIRDKLALGLREER